MDVNQPSQRWYYAFKDIDLVTQEEKDWVHRATKNKNFSSEAYNQKRSSFGTIVLESDLDLEPQVAFDAYQSRWEIELVMRYYKHACEFDETRVHDDFSVIASEFCDFRQPCLLIDLSTVLTAATWWMAGKHTARFRGCCAERKK